MIIFNKPKIFDIELSNIKQALDSGKISGDGSFTKKCHSFFLNRYGFKKCLLTTSCTDALEMSAILCNIKPGDEVIAPSYTFVSTVNAFVLRGAKIIFADSRNDIPNINEKEIESLITKKTKVIIPVHYAGVACDMDFINSIATKHNLLVVEDAAQCIESFYKNKPLGSLGDLGTFSFHETKNITCGEGGLLVINNEQFLNRSEIIREKGTNRSAFFRGEVDKYGWVDIGSSFLPSDILAAFLYAQLINLENIQTKRISIWNRYYSNLKNLQDNGTIRLPVIPDYATNNAHMFYVLCRNLEERTMLIDHLKTNNISSVFHYLSLHKSEFYKDKHDGRLFPNSDRYTDTLLRLPMYYDLSFDEVDYVCEKIIEWSKTFK